MGGIGLTLFGLGSLGLGWLTCVWLLTNIFGAGFDPIGSRPLLHYSVAALLLGAQAISLGFVAELLISYTGRDIDTYSIAERTGPGSRNRETAEVS